MCDLCRHNTCVMKSTIITITSRAGLLALHLALYHWGEKKGGGGLRVFAAKKKKYCREGTLQLVGVFLNVKLFELFMHTPETTNENKINRRIKVTLA